MAVSRAELRKKNTMPTRQGPLGGGNWRWRSVEKRVGRKAGDGGSDGVGVEFFDCVFVSEWVEAAVGQERLDDGTIFGSESLLHRAGSRRKSDNGVGRVGRTQGTGEELGREEINVVRDRKNVGLPMEMVLEAKFMAAGDDSERFILDTLKFDERRRGDI